VIIVINVYLRATLGNRAEVVMLLIRDGGANPLQTDYLGKTPFVWLTERFQSSHLSHIKSSSSSSSSSSSQLDFKSLSSEIQNNLRAIIECMESWMTRNETQQFDPNFIKLQMQIEKFKSVCYRIDQLNYNSQFCPTNHHHAHHNNNNNNSEDVEIEDDPLAQLESLLCNLAI
jgi:hypothetical protein